MPTFLQRYPKAGAILVQWHRTGLAWVWGEEEKKGKEQREGEKRRREERGRWDKRGGTDFQTINYLVGKEQITPNTEKNKNDRGTKEKKKSYGGI